jgi:hypothetical protein
VIPVIKAVLKRGVLVTAANWEVVLFQFVAETSFKALLAVPIAGGTILLTLLVGDEVPFIPGRDLREVLGLVVIALETHRAALVAFVGGVGAVLLGGSLLVALVASGATAIVVQGEASAPAVERPPLRWSAVQRARAFSLERYVEGVSRYGARFVHLALILIAVYFVLLVGYLGTAVAGYRALAGHGYGLLATMFAAGASAIVVVIVGVVNLAYLLAQVAVVRHGRSAGGALRAVAALAGAQGRMLAAIFVVLMALMGLATAASVLATGLLGFVGFVPIVGVAALPLQLMAWLGRGLLFQFLGFAAVGACSSVARRSESGGTVDGWSPFPRPADLTAGRTA